VGNSGVWKHGVDLSHPPAATCQSSNEAMPSKPVRPTTRPTGDSNGMPATKGTEMEPRMNHPAMVVSGAMDALQALSTTAARTGVPFATRKMVELRASQINDCSFCVDMHTRELRKAGESEERIATVAAWREAPWFSGAERAALALTEAVTRLADRPGSVTDEIWQAAADHYDEAQLGGLLIEIGSINVWNPTSGTASTPPPTSSPAATRSDRRARIGDGSPRTRRTKRARCATLRCARSSQASGQR
jgi:AhpD family alkylhydroperoxidase